MSFFSVIILPLHFVKKNVQLDVFILLWGKQLYSSTKLKAIVYKSWWFSSDNINHHHRPQNRQSHNIASCDVWTQPQNQISGKLSLFHFNTGFQSHAKQYYPCVIIGLWREVHWFRNCIYLKQHLCVLNSRFLVPKTENTQSSFNLCKAYMT